jgi:hypothetical protein
MIKKKFMGIIVLLGTTVVVMAAIFINVNFGAKSNILLTISLADVETLAGEGGTVYKWSNDIDCPGLWNGDYQVCQVDGYQNVCTNPGGRTCTCGSSKNWNNDGNCD